jgi:hypothetical protein
MPERVPSQIGRYRIVGVVGQWTAVLVPSAPATGWLYRGRDEMLDRDV